jgi:hypothetical protein
VRSELDFYILFGRNIRGFSLHEIHDQEFLLSPRHVCVMDVEIIEARNDVLAKANINFTDKLISL